MAQATIADAAREFQTLIEYLDDAYWEASNICQKDIVYDVLSIFHQEIAELNKLSIQDHHYDYEKITEGMQQVKPKLIRLEEQLYDVVERTKTQVNLKKILKSVKIIL